jgi:glucan biosynthesis protein C
VGQFLCERAIRLLVPFVTGLLIVVPPLVYYQLKGDPEYAEGYLGFYPRFSRVRPAWSFPLFVKGAPPDKLFTINHLYFLVYLFAFTVILLPLWLYLLKPAGQRLVECLAAFLSRSWAIFILALPISIIEGALGTEPLGAWNRFAWAPFIVYGFLFACDGRFGQALRRQ